MGIRFMGSIFFAVLALGCSGDEPGAELQPPPECPGGTPQVSYARVYREVFSTACVTCHRPQGQAPTDLSTFAAGYANTVNQPSRYGSLARVTPNELGASVLYIKMIGGSPPYSGRGGQSVGGVMPPGGTVLTSQTQKDLVRDWICSGAAP